MDCIDLRLRSGRRRLRALTGEDQRALHGGAGAARGLLARLCVDDDGPGATDIGSLSAADRDRLLAALWQHEFGDTILATHRCGDCRELFDLSFSLAGLVESLEAMPRPEDVDGMTPDGHARLKTGQTVRPPTAVDEAAVAAMPVATAADALARRCVSGGALPAPDVLDRVLDWLDPVVDVDLVGVCPECGARQAVRFSIEHYLMTALRLEQRRLMREIHLLAATYGWSLGEVLSLDRQERQVLTAHVEADRHAARAGAWP